MMSFEELFLVEPEILRVTTPGEYAFDELFGFLDRVKARADAERRQRVLIDSRSLEGNMTEAERFQGGQRIAEVFGGRIKLALLMQKDRTTKLGELTAVNRGARFLITDSESEAVEWLLEN